MRNNILGEQYHMHLKSHQWSSAQRLNNRIIQHMSFSLLPPTTSINFEFKIRRDHGKNFL